MHFHIHHHIELPPEVLARLDEFASNLDLIMIQNEAILAKLEDRASKLSPEDQAKLNRIFDLATGDASKVDVALNPT